MENKKKIKEPTLFTAVLPLIFMFVVLFTGLASTALISRSC